jgi:hypothetical protein
MLFIFLERFQKNKKIIKFIILHINIVIDKGAYSLLN